MQENGYLQTQENDTMEYLNWLTFNNPKHKYLEDVSLRHALWSDVVESNTRLNVSRETLVQAIRQAPGLMRQAIKNVLFDIIYR